MRKIMSVQDVIQKVRLINRQDKLRVLRVLVDTLVPAEEVGLETEAKVWLPQVTDPESMAFVLEVEHVLNTQGLEAANKMLRRGSDTADATNP
jgi:hypothetical protein